MNELPLKDIHLPDGVSWWPPAPGWWVLGVVLIVFLFLMLLLLPKLWRWLRYKTVRSLSLKEFYLIQQAYQRQADQKITLQALTSLLRRTAMSKSGRIGHAGIVGDDWISQLNQISNKGCFTQAQAELLKHGGYQPAIQGGNEADIDSLLKSCETWIKSLPRGGSHAAT
jgi:hypothetical protein